MLGALVTPSFVSSFARSFGESGVSSCVMVNVLVRLILSVKCSNNLSNRIKSIPMPTMPEHGNIITIFDYSVFFVLRERTNEREHKKEFHTV